jgi:hypothetical protein
MAVPTGSGTETIHAHHFEDINVLLTDLIIGVQHHTYTVLCYISHCTSLGTAATDVGMLQLRGYDSFGGTTDSVIQIATYQIQALETFVWNDKFSFFGAEPANFTGPLSTAAEQVAIAAQGSTPVSQTLEHSATDTAAIYDVHVTYLDQDWT